MAGSPTYDPAAWVGGIDASTYARLTGTDSGSPLLPRPYGAASAPGSLFKVISTAAAAMDGYDLAKTYPCPSSYEVGNQTFRNMESESHRYHKMPPPNDL